MDQRWTEFEPPSVRGEASIHTGWTRCFNESATRPRYAHALYGLPTAPFAWAQLDIVYLRLLVGLNMTCFLNSDHVYRREIQGAVFVDYPERTRIANGAAINRGGVRLSTDRPPQVHRWPWVEVMHNPSYGVATQGAQVLWMYMARGSGIWFHPGRVLALSDVWDLAVYLNETRNYNPRAVESKTILMARAKEMLANEFDSISFAFHVDGGCCHRMVMRELVSLHNFTHGCPVSDRFMRRGWPPDSLRHCNCSSTERLVHAHVCG
jgi:hypothetical protein